MTSLSTWQTFCDHIVSDSAFKAESVHFQGGGGGRSGGAMVLGKLPVPGRPTIWISVGQGPIALAVGAGGGGLDIFTLVCPFFPLSPSLWETARYRLKFCLKGPLNPKPTNQPIYTFKGINSVIFDFASLFSGFSSFGEIILFKGYEK